MSQGESSRSVRMARWIAIVSAEMGLCFVASIASLLFVVEDADGAEVQHKPAITLAQARVPNLPPALPGDNPKAREEARKKAELEARRKAGRARLEALLAGRSGSLLIRRADTARIESVYIYGSYSPAAIGYKHTVSERSLDLPPEASATSHPEEMARALRNEPGVALVVDSNIFRRGVFESVVDLDLVVTDFPPKGAPDFSSQYADALAALAPGDAPLLMIRRRDGERMANRLLVQEVAQVSFAVSFIGDLGAKISSANEGLKSYGLDKFVKYDSASLEFPVKSESIRLRDAPDALHRDKSAAVVLTRAGLQAIYPRIANLDLIVVRSPPIEVHFGLAKDRQETAESFSIAGISGRMDASAVSAALATAFAPSAISRDPDKGLIRAARGQCDVPDMRDAGVSAEAGTSCVLVTLKDGKAAQILHRQVLAGDVTDAALEALKKRYGYMELSREVRHLERGGMRILIGYGAVLTADRRALGRVESLPPPTAMEAVVWKGNGATTVVLQIDSAPTVFEAKAAKNAAFQLDPAPRAAQPSQSPPPPTASGPRCGDEPGLRSTQGAVPTSITFVNRMAVSLRLYWIDYQGARRPYGVLGPYQTHQQQTYVTHPWVLTDEGDNCVAVYLPAADAKVVYVTGERASVPGTAQAKADTAARLTGQKHSAADKRLVGVWAPVAGAVSSDDPDFCAGDMGIRYSSDGTYETLYQVGTWRLDGDRLTKTATEATDAAEPDSVKLGQALTTRISWHGADTVVITGVDGQEITLRRCPAAIASPARAHSADADAPVREQIARGCANKPGTIEPASVIERELTGDGKIDLIVHHHGIACERGGRSIFCGAQECTANLYVRRGAQLHPAGEFGAVEWIKIEGGKIPTIHTIVHGGKPRALKWNGREFRVVSARFPSAPGVFAKTVDHLIREQIAEACEGKQGTIEPAAVIERDLTGDGKADLIVSHDGISCVDGRQSGFCGAQVCSVMIYVRRGGLLKPEVTDLLGTGVSIGEGKVPEIHMYAHGGTLNSMRWNGRTFAPVISRRAAQKSAAEPAAPNGHGRIEGELSFPSDYIPDDMTVCAENILTRHKHCNSKRRRERQADSYTLIVPPGKYHVYARTKDMPNVRAYYSDFVTCGLDAKCRSHRPIVVEVAAGTTVKSVHPQDWYNQAQ